MGYETAYTDNHVSFEITDIVWEDDYVKQFGLEVPDVDPSSLSGQEFQDRYLGGADRRLDSLSEDVQASINEDIDEDIEEYDATVERVNELKNTIEFEYKAPAISVDTSGRFVKHDIIGGSTVRQKIGEDPIEVSIKGVCKEPVARRLDQLRNAKYGTILSKRLPDESLTVQFASTTTSPLDDGGAVAMADDDGEFLYTYTLSTVEILS